MQWSRNRGARGPVASPNILIGGPPKIMYVMAPVSF